MEDNLTLMVGEKKKINIRAYYDDDTEAKNIDWQYRFSDSNAAIVNEGFILPLKLGGQTIITIFPKDNQELSAQLTLDIRKAILINSTDVFEDIVLPEGIGNVSINIADIQDGEEAVFESIDSNTISVSPIGIVSLQESAEEGKLVEISVSYGEKQAKVNLIAKKIVDVEEITFENQNIKMLITDIKAGVGNQVAYTYSPQNATYKPEFSINSTTDDFSIDNDGYIKLINNKIVENKNIVVTAKSRNNIVSSDVGVCIISPKDPDNMVLFCSLQPLSVNTETLEKYWAGTIQYTSTPEITDSWKAFIGTTVNAVQDQDGVYVLYFRGTGNNIITGKAADNNPNFPNYTGSVYRYTYKGSQYKKKYCLKLWVLSGNNISILGNIMSLLDYQNFDSVTMGDYAFANMFTSYLYLGTYANDATPSSTSYYERFITYVSPNFLPSKNLSKFCYLSMFHGNKHLVLPPSLPADELKADCYTWMFNGCESLSALPYMPFDNIKSYPTFTNSPMLGSKNIKFSKDNDDGSKIKYLEVNSENVDFVKRMFNDDVPRNAEVGDILYTQNEIIYPKEI